MKKTTPLLIGGGVVIVALVVVIAVMAGKLNSKSDATAADDVDAPRNVVVNEKNIDEMVDQMLAEEPTPAGAYQVTMNTTWYFRDGTSVSNNAYVENVENNTNDVYFDVEMADTGEIIYKSPLLPLGSHINSIALDKDLDEGTYDCVCVYHLVDEEQKTLSTLRMSVTIVIQG